MKTINEIIKGKHLRDVYPCATRFQVFKFRVRKFTRRVFVIYIASFVIVTSYLATYEAGRAEKSITVFATETDSSIGKIEKAKEDLLTTLSHNCEIKGRRESDANIVLDTNKKFSIGPFMFQIDTVKSYYKQIYGKIITGQEAIAIANDSALSRQLAKDIIFKTDSGVKTDWVNCNKWNSLQVQVDLIKKIENN